MNDFPVALYLTADHGMNAKTEAVDLERILAARGIQARAMPIIKDRYAAYVYLEPPSRQRTRWGSCGRPAG